MSEPNIFGVGEAPAPWLSEPEEATTEAPAEDEAEGSPAEEAAPEAEEAPEIEAAPAEEELQPGDDEAIEAAEQDLAEGTTVPLDEWINSQPEHLWANKYQTVQALEDGYRERSRMWNQELERRKAEEAERIREQQQRLELEEGLKQVIPILKEAAEREEMMRQVAEQYRQQFGSYPEGYRPPAPRQAPPANQPQDVNALIEQRLAQEREQMQQQFAAQQQAELGRQLVDAFQAQHPDFEWGSEADGRMQEALNELNNSPMWERADREVDPFDLGTLELLHEVSQRPMLLEVLKLRPEYFDSEVGLSMARREAARLEGTPDATLPQSTTVPASRARTGAGSKVPYAESAQGSVPQDAGPDMDDPWNRVKAVDGPGTRHSIFE